MKIRRTWMLLSVLPLLVFFYPALFRGMMLYDSYQADLTVGFVRLCMWDWIGIPPTLMYFAGSMLLGAMLVQVNPSKRWKRMLLDVAVGLYTIPFMLLFFLNRHYSSAFYIMLPLLPVLGIFMRRFRAVQYGICAISGGLLIWGLIVCVVSDTHGAHEFVYFAACMLIPNVMLLRALLCPNSRIASVMAVAITGWSVYIVSQEFSQKIIRLTKQWPKPNSVYQVLYYGIICALILSLICLIIDTVFVFLSHRKTAIPAVPGDPQTLAEE